MRIKMLKYQAKDNKQLRGYLGYDGQSITK